MSELVPSVLPLDKGLDLQTAKIIAPPGSVLDSINYEQVDFQGQKRIEGYARYDGSASSAMDEYYVLTFSGDSDIFLEPGGVLLNDGKPFGVVASVFDKVITYTRTDDTVVLDVDDQFVYVPREEEKQVSVAMTVVSDVKGMTTTSDPTAHYDTLLDSSYAIRNNVESLPGPIAGLHWFKDRLYAVASLQKFRTGLITLGDLPDMNRLTVVNYSYTAMGGEGPYVFTIDSGSLPTGLSMSSSGNVTGTATVAGNYSWTVKVTDSLSNISYLNDNAEVVKILTDLFAISLYTGTGSQPRNVPSLDFSNGGTCLLRPRAVGWTHMLWGNSVGPASMKSFAGSPAEFPSINQLTSTGITVNTPIFNTLATNYFTYSFANYPNFAQTVTWTGNGATTRDIPHGLGAVPGAILVAHPANANYIDMYHRSLGPTQYLPMNSGNTLTTTPTAWGNTAPNATTFRVGSRYNATSVVYTALVLAHDDTATGMIQCGSYVGNGAAVGPAVSLGWQPQMLLVKAITGGATQFMTDTTRSPGFTGNDELAYISVSNNVSNNFNLYELISGGFRPGSSFSESNANGATHIYVAVRAP